MTIRFSYKLDPTLGKYIGVAGDTDYWQVWVKPTAGVSVRTLERALRSHGHYITGCVVEVMLKDKNGIPTLFEPGEGVLGLKAGNTDLKGMVRMREIEAINCLGTLDNFNLMQRLRHRLPNQGPYLKRVV
jgi:hypothetical protein